MHHADPSDVTQPHRVSMMLECSIGELLAGKLLARAAFMHHEDQGHDALRHHTALKGLMSSQLDWTPNVSDKLAGQ